MTSLPQDSVHCLQNGFCMYPYLRDVLLVMDHRDALTLYQTTKY